MPLYGFKIDPYNVSQKRSIKMKVQIQFCGELLLRQQAVRTKNWLSHSFEYLMRTKRATVQYQL